MSKAEAKEAAAAQQNVFMRAIKLLGDIFVPIIPAIVASGLLLGIMNALNFMSSNGYIALDTDNFVYKIADLVSGTSFSFLQILIGYSAATAFGANPYLGAVIGIALTNLAASGTGVTGVFGILLCLASPVQYVVMFAVAAAVSFVISFALYKDEK